MELLTTHSRSFGNNSLSFKGNRELKRIRKEIAPILDSCRYTKRNIVENHEKLSFKIIDGQIFLTGFHTPNDREGEITGICEELTQKTGEILREKYKGKYTPICLDVKNKKYGFESHSAILLVKENKNTRKILNEIDRNTYLFRKAQRLYKEARLDPTNRVKVQEYRQLREKVLTLLQENAKEINDCKAFKDSIFIDPSFNVIEKLKKAHKYDIVKQFGSLSYNNPYESPGRIISNTLVPLGFVFDIFPQLAEEENYPPDKILYFFLAGSDKKRIDIGIKDNEGKNLYGYKLDYLKENYPDAEIVSFLEKLNAEISNSNN